MSNRPHCLPPQRLHRHDYVTITDTLESLAIATMDLHEQGILLVPRNSNGSSSQKLESEGIVAPRKK